MPHVFADGADIQAWARSDVYWAYNSGVMNGVSGNRFAPNNSYTHEQSIATMLRLYDTKYAEVPSGEIAAEYAVVMDDEGGARCTVADAHRERKGQKVADRL